MHNPFFYVELLQTRDGLFLYIIFPKQFSLTTSQRPGEVNLVFHKTKNKQEKSRKSQKNKYFVQLNLLFLVSYRTLQPL